jgi:3',5'-cyclic-AMP phosphodiesterase
MGIAGNHDSFGTEEEFNDFVKGQGINYLNENIINLEQHKWSGINGIIGRPDKANRINENDYYRYLKKNLNKQPDVILLHQVPSFPEFYLKGNDIIRGIINNSFPAIYICGHVEWKDKFFIEMSNGSQVLNVDNRVIILVNSKFDVNFHNLWLIP